MEDLNKMLSVDVNKATLNLLIDNKADILINQKLLVQILAHLENRSIDEIQANIKTKWPEVRQAIVDDLPKVIA